MIKMKALFVAVSCAVLMLSLVFAGPVTASESRAVEKLRGGDVQGSIIEFLKEKIKGSSASLSMGNIIMWIIYIVLFILFPKEFTTAWNYIVDYWNPDGVQSLSL